MLPRGRPRALADNHHYGNSILGEGVKLVKDARPLELDDTKMAEDAQSLFPGYSFVADTEATRRGGPREAAAAFSNGGEWAVRHRLDRSLGTVSRASPPLPIPATYSTWCPMGLFFIGC